MADDVHTYVEESGIEEELEVLKSIYIDELNLKTSESGRPELLSLQLHPSTGDEVEKKYVCVTLMLQPTQAYPHEIPRIDIEYPRGIGEEEVNRLQTSLITLATELQGGPMLYNLIELAKESLTEGNVPHCPCTICYEHFHKDEEFTKTACYHYFHHQCLSRYIKHVLENIELENQSHPTHLQRDDNQTKAPCPVCREEIDCNLDIVTREITTKDQMQTFVPSAEMKKWQKEMSRLLKRQREKGGVIDMEEEKNKFLVTQDDVVEIGSITNRSQGRGFPITKDTETSEKNDVSLKSKTNEKGGSEPGNERFVWRDFRGRGRGKHFGRRKESDKTYGQQEGETDSYSLRKGDIRSYGEMKQAGDKKKKSGDEKMTERNQESFRKPHRSKTLDMDRSENNQTDNSESEGQISAFKMSEGNNHGSAAKSQDDRPKQGFRRPKSAKTNKGFQETDKQQLSGDGVSIQDQEGPSETESKESGRHGEKRKGFGRPKSHRETNLKKQESPRKGQSTPNQDGYSESEDKESTTHKESWKGFSKPLVIAEQSVRKGNTRRGFGQPPKGTERNRGRSDRNSKSWDSQSEKPLSGGRWGVKCLEDKEREQWRWSAIQQTTKDDTRDNRNISNQERRYDRKSTSKVSKELENRRPRLSPERLLVKDGEMAKSENGRGKCDKDNGPRESSSGTASDQKRRPRTPPGFHLSGPPPGLGAPVCPPPGFSDCS